MLIFPEINPNQSPYPISNLITSFRKDGDSNNPPDLIFTPNLGDPNRYPIRVLVIGIPPGVTYVINELHVRKFSEVAAWSPAMNASHPGEIMRVMTRDFLMSS